VFGLCAMLGLFAVVVLYGFFAVDSGVVLIKVKRMLSLRKVCEGCFD